MIGETDASSSSGRRGSHEREQETTLRKEETLRDVLGAARDLSAAAIPVSKMSFGLAGFFVSTGFDVGRKTVQFLGESTQVVSGGPNIFSQSMFAVDKIIHAASAITLTSMEASNRLTEAGLALTKHFLGAVGIEHGTLGDLVPATEAIVQITNMIYQFFEDDGDGDDSEKSIGKYEVLVGILALSRLQALEDARTQAPISTLADSHDLAEVRYFYRFAVASYGKAACKFLGILPYDTANLQHSLEAFALLAGCVRETDIVYSCESGSMYRPGHFVAVDRTASAIVVAIRGTMRVQDVLTDLVCKGISVPSSWTIKENTTFFVHEGMMKAALTLHTLLCDVVAEQLERHKGYRLIVCGHSLGGGTAALLAMHWTFDTAPSSKRLRNAAARAARCGRSDVVPSISSIAFACPCVASIPLSRLVRRMGDRTPALLRIHSVVLNNDMVPRFGLKRSENIRDMIRILCQYPRANDRGHSSDIAGNTNTLARIIIGRLGAMGAVDRRTAEQNSDLLGILERARRTCTKNDRPMLYPPGHVLHMRTPSDTSPGIRVGVTEIDPVRVLSELKITGDMFSAHMPQAYWKALGP